MVNQNQFTMKQPELGRKILELRKAKGLTQEELVSKCNINVRTIQRIEAGEVTPRSYTVKTILEALEYELDTIQFQDRADTLNHLPNQDTNILKTAFFTGIVYFALALVESFLDLKVWGVGFPLATFHDGVSFYTYLGIKVSVLVTFGMFMVGYYRLATYYPNAIVKTTSLMLAALTVISVSVDVYSFYTQDANEFFLPVQAVSFGIVYVVFGIGIIKYRNTFGDLAFAAGVMGIICGLFLMTVVLALPGLVLIAVFEILQLIMLYRAVEGHKAETSTAAVI